jgi:hypothetical protein
MSAPSVLQQWAYQPATSVMILHRELYQSRIGADQMGEWAKAEIESKRVPIPEAIVCDHDDLKKNEFEKHSGLRLTLADKEDRDKGLAEMQTRFREKPTSKPTIYFRPGCRVVLRGEAADGILLESGLPTSTIEELTGYIYDPKILKDSPIDYNDHGCDAARYASRYVGLSSMLGMDAMDKAFQSKRHGEKLLPE